MTTIPPKDNPESHPVAKVWQVGTLIYTRSGLFRLFFWLLCGDFALNIRDRAVPPLMQTVFSKFGASDLVVALIFSSIPSALGLFVGPIVSYKSDRLRTRWGRRIPFLIAPIPFILLTTVGLAFSPALGPHLSHALGHWSPGPNGPVILLMGLFWTIFEVSCFVGYAVFAPLVNDVVPQETIGRFYGLFRAVGLIAGIAFFMKVMDAAEGHPVAIFLTIGAIFGVAFSAMCLNVKEGDYPPSPALSERPGLLSAVKTYFKDGFGNPYYLWFFAATVLAGFSAGPFNLYSLFYAKSIGLPLHYYWQCIGLSYTISLILAYPLGSLADRFHPLRLTIVGLAVYALAMLSGGLLVRTPTMFAIFFVIHNVVSGSLFTAWASLPQRLLPRNKFAEMGSVGGIIGNVANLILSPLLGIFLGYEHRNYVYTFYASAGYTLLALGAFIVLHAKFMALGGPEHYVAPE